MRHLTAVAVVAAFACSLSIVACGDDDSNKPASSSTSSSGGSSSGGSSSGGSSTGGSSSGGSSSGSTGTLYERLGKKAGIDAAVGEVVKAELADPEIASYFVFVGKPGHPATAAQIQECLVNQLGSAAGGPASEVTYPTTVSGGFMCRDMKAAHAGLGIPPGTFDKFVSIAAAKLKELKVADADIATIGAVLNGTKNDVVTDTTRQSGPFIGDAGQ